MRSWAARTIFPRVETHGRTPGAAAARALACLAALAALALVLAARNASARAEADPALVARLSRALAVPHVNQSRTAALAVELPAGRTVFVRSRALSLAPASTEKLAVSYALLTTLGPVYRIRTSVLGDGGLDGGTWYGDLVLKGSGDPTLSSAALRRLAAQVHALGIRRVAGSVVGDESFFDARRTAPGWKASYYIGESAPLSALTVDGGRYGGRITRQPALAAATVFRSALRAAGVAVTGGVRTGRSEAASELAYVSSPPLLRVLRLVNAESDNLTAELLLKHLGAVETGQGTTAAGAAVVRRELELSGVPLAGVRIVDGSGLSLLDRLTVDALVGILTAAWRDPLLRGSFIASLAVSGRSGTLRERLRTGGLRGQLFAKTGTTARASALSGYVGGRYAFAVLQNGPPLSTWWSRLAQDRFVTVLARQ